MERILSTYRFLQQQLNNTLLAEIAAAGFTSVEVFCAPHHFNYSSSQAVRELGDGLREHKLTLHSLHAPTERDLSPGRESGVPLSISIRNAFAASTPWMKSSAPWKSAKRFPANI